MYSPETFRSDDETLIEKVIRDHPFAQMLSGIGEEIEVTHLPVYRFRDSQLVAHVAAANPQAKLPDGTPLMLIFNGPHAYVSPHDYSSEFNVPTWNYAAVHVKGVIEFIDDEEQVWESFREMVEITEGAAGWKLPDENRYRDLMTAVRFFRILNPSYEAKFKFNQNKSAQDVKAVMEAMKSKGKDRVVKFMKEIHKNHG